MDEFKKKFLAADLSMSPRDKAKRNRRVRAKLKDDDAREHHYDWRINKSPAD